MNPRLSRLHTEEDGHIAVLAMLGSVAMVVLIAWVMNTGSLISRRIEVQNAADAAAVTQASWTARSLNVMAMNQTAMTQALAVNVVGAATAQVVAEAFAVTHDRIFEICRLDPVKPLGCLAALLFYELPVLIPLAKMFDVAVDFEDGIGAGLANILRPLGRSEDYRKIAVALSAMNDTIVKEHPDFSKRVATALATQNHVDLPILYARGSRNPKPGVGPKLPVERVNDLVPLVVLDLGRYGGTGSFLPLPVGSTFCKLAERAPSASRTYENLSHYRSDPRVSGDPSKRSPGRRGPFARVYDINRAFGDLLFPQKWIHSPLGIPGAYTPTKIKSLKKIYESPGRKKNHTETANAITDRLTKNAPLPFNWKNPGGYCRLGAVAQNIPFPEIGAIPHVSVRHTPISPLIKGGYQTLSLYRVKERPIRASTLPRKTREALSVLALTKKNGAPALVIDRFESAFPDLYGYAQAEVYNVSKTRGLFSRRERLAGYDLFTQGWRGRLVPATLAVRDRQRIAALGGSYRKLAGLFKTLGTNVGKLNDH